MGCDNNDVDINAQRIHQVPALSDSLVRGRFDPYEAAVFKDEGAVQMLMDTALLLRLTPVAQTALVHSFTQVFLTRPRHLHPPTTSIITFFAKSIPFHHRVCVPHNTPNVFNMPKL
jgi:hypothetical protein